MDFYCNNQALINRLESVEEQEIPFKWQEYDDICNIQQAKPSNGRFIQVKGH
jgi:hypothetical protein